jgi:hypothetical protein
VYIATNFISVINGGLFLREIENKEVALSVEKSVLRGHGTPTATSKALHQYFQIII